ncbi:MAG: hypothetical protein R3F29_13860 [Planctomycetota bacterium]
MRIEVVDPFEHGLGLALGLVELGHQVRYVDGGARSMPGEVARMRRELVERVLGGRHDDARGDAELTIVVGVFADQLASLQHARRHGGVAASQLCDLGELIEHGGPRSYPVQLQRAAELLERCGAACVVDMSDAVGPREALFEALPGVQLFARERAVDEDSPWQPFPFLFNSVVLWLERMTATADWLQSQRQRRWDWVFCGTVGSARYGARRSAAIARIAQQHPQLAGAVFGDIGFAQVLAVLQSARFGLDLPGVGDLCFRLHECLAVGTPLWRPFAGRVQLPDGIAQLVFAQPDEAPDCSAEAVRAIAAEYYSPMAAARWLLERAGQKGRPSVFTDWSADVCPIDSDNRVVAQSPCHGLLRK